jgi:hypothetical protein
VSLDAETVAALQAVLHTLPGTGYRSVSVSYPLDGVDGLVTLTLSMGDPGPVGDE